MADLTDRDAGFLVGLLCGEGHFGGDGRQPQVTLRMHARHEQLFRWLERRIPGSRLYGPYHHGGRHYYQWMARGRCLREELLPLLVANADLLDGPAADRLRAMCGSYGLPFPTVTGEPGPACLEGAPSSSPSPSPPAPRRGGAPPGS